MSWGNQYVQVSSSFMQKIKEIEEKQNAIPEYQIQLKEIEGFENKSKYENIVLMKHNLEEIERKHKNDEEKGKNPNSYGYARFSRMEKYVFPIFDHIFNLDKLSEEVNELVEKGCNEYWDDWESKKNHDHLTKRNYPIHHYIHFIRDCRQQLLWAIEKCSDIRKLQLIISIDWDDLNTCIGTKVEETNKEYLIPDCVNFFIAYDDKIVLYKCRNGSREPIQFENFLQVSAYWVKNRKNVDRYKLSEWKKALKNPNSVITTDFFQGKKAE